MGRRTYDKEYKLSAVKLVIDEKQLVLKKPCLLFL